MYELNNPGLQDRIKSVKATIERLIEEGRLDEAKTALKQYESMMPGDPDICSMRAVAHILEGSLDEAQYVLLEGLKRDSVQFDLLFNLAYIRELQGQYQEAADLYCKAGTVAISDEHKQNVIQAVEKLRTIDTGISTKDRAKVVFFVKEGMDNFLGDIISGLSDEFWVRKIIVSDLKQIDNGMEWADICWFEWCDELIIYGSSLPLSKVKKIICRLHSYEAFTDYINKVDWNNIDKVIFIAEHIRDFVLNAQKSLRLEQTVVIPNGISVDKFTFGDRKPGFNVAYVGYINYKKGPMLLLHTFKALYDRDHRYKLHIAGTFQDYRDQLYFDQMIREFGIADNVIYDGWQNDLNQWLNDKDYILCTSILESQNVSVMQAMCKGIKPVIHNFVGAKNIYPEKYVWNTIDEAVDMVLSKSYNSSEYYELIVKNYNEKETIKIIRSLFLFCLFI